VTRLISSVAVACFLAAGCATTPEKGPDYSQLVRENPRSVLIVPVLNNSPEVGADDYFLATVTVPVAEHGYYVFPVNMTKHLLADAGLSDPGLVHNADPTRVAGLFGADSILYVRIQNWESKYLVLSTTVTVGFEYLLVSGKTGETLWQSASTMVYTPQTPSSGNPIADLIVMAVQAAVTKAKPNYMPLARQANWAAFTSKHVGSGQPSQYGYPVLMGPYHPRYGEDRVGIAVATPVVHEEAAQAETETDATSDTAADATADAAD